MKKIFSIFLLFGIIIFGCFAQNSDFKYYSSVLDGDFENNFRGYAVAVFLGSADDSSVEDFQKFWDIFPEDIKCKKILKLTKNNMWLCNKALSEWEYEVGEIYVISFADSLSTKEVPLILAKITGEGEFTWSGVMIDENNMKSFMETVLLFKK